MKDYLNENTRIVLKWHLPAMDNVLALQRKKWYGWKTVSFIYPSIMKSTNEQLQDILNMIIEMEKTNKVNIDTIKWVIKNKIGLNRHELERLEGTLNCKLCCGFRRGEK